MGRGDKKTKKGKNLQGIIRKVKTSKGYKESCEEESIKSVVSCGLYVLGITAKFCLI